MLKVNYRHLLHILYLITKVKENDEESEPSDDDDDEAAATVIPARHSGPTELDTHPIHPDDRPITPMQNRMVYDIDHSSLDFQDGE